VKSHALSLTQGKSSTNAHEYSFQNWRSLKILIEFKNVIQQAINGNKRFFRFLSKLYSFQNLYFELIKNSKSLKFRWKTVFLVSLIINKDSKSLVLMLNLICIQIRIRGISGLVQLYKTELMPEQFNWIRINLQLKFDFITKLNWLWSIWKRLFKTHT